ncbi:MAG: 4Fe-4S binding protein [Pirellulaceae bacterium]|nr:4Fe-4S binding protein [Pirellulaceae bacterium]
MRFNWFLPALRKRRPGAIRRILRRLGTTWAASPFRRAVQTLCLLTFVWLFVYVCWPYSAKPALKWPGWAPVEVSVDKGAVTLVHEQGLEIPNAVGTVLHLVDDSMASPVQLGAFRVVQADAGRLQLLPSEPLSAEQAEQLADSFGPWTLFQSKPGDWPSHYADTLRGRERLDAESFLIVDPLVSLSTAVAARQWIWSLAAAGAILAVCLIIPRGFCGYLCPLGTLIDLFDWLVGRRFTRFRVADNGWWVHLKYFVLAAVLVAAAFGVLLAGFVSAIPVVTRFFAFAVTTSQTGLLRGWHQVPSLESGHWLSLALFVLVLALGFLRPRFWCKYVCPTGAVFSLGNLFRMTGRKVHESCIHCDKCIKVCPFDAIKPDFTTRTTDCTFCQTCGGVCPTQAITFVDRWNRQDWKAVDDPPTGETPIGRRGFLSTAAGLAAGLSAGAGLAGLTRTFGAGLGDSARALPVRPPGSVPEQQFLQMCIRCGECFQACPNDVLQPMGWQQGLEGLWTPRVVADWSGCEPSCSNCGQVCPTGAIRALPLEEKRFARMGLAVLDLETCLPYAGRDDCQLCVDECAVAGYHAIEFIRVGTEVDPFGQPVEGTGRVAPVVVAHQCVGCGLCQTRCYTINHKQKGLLAASAIVVQAGADREDRMLAGSYRSLREAEQQERDAQRQRLLDESGTENRYLPDFLQ